ncbi:hypothetical protein HYT24_01200, partial [Candidatus Pacearchaeota archaeon]|nr:hypothetical protein [Candidatus Pacearchaeota archaeon]
MGRYGRDEVHSSEGFRRIAENEFPKIVANRLMGWNIKVSDEPEFS